MFVLKLVYFLLPFLSFLMFFFEHWKRIVVESKTTISLSTIMQYFPLDTFRFVVLLMRKICLALVYFIYRHIQTHIQKIETFLEHQLSLYLFWKILPFFWKSIGLQNRPKPLTLIIQTTKMVLSRQYSKDTGESISMLAFNDIKNMVEYTCSLTNNRSHLWYEKTK